MLMLMLADTLPLVCTVRVAVMLLVDPAVANVLEEAVVEHASSTLLT